MNINCFYKGLHRGGSSKKCPKRTVGNKQEKSLLSFSVICEYAKKHSFIRKDESKIRKQVKKRGKCLETYI